MKNNQQPVANEPTSNGRDDFIPLMTEFIAKLSGLIEHSKTKGPHSALAKETLWDHWGELVQLHHLVTDVLAEADAHDAETRDTGQGQRAA